MVICAGLVSVCSARTARRTAKRYSAKQLIAKIIASEKKIHDVELHYDDIIMKDSFILSSFDWGCEGDKEYLEGKIFSRANPEQNRPAYEKKRRCAFDGEKCYLLNERVSWRNGQIRKQGLGGRIDSSKMDYITIWPKPTRFLGYGIVKSRPTHRSTMTLGELLRTARKVSVKPELENIDGHLCTVVEAIGVKDVAKISSGAGVRYEDCTWEVRAWIDTGRDFRPLRIEKYYGDKGPLSVGGRNRWQVLSCRIEKIKLEKIDGVWFPVDGIATWFSTKTILPPDRMTEDEFRRLARKKQRSIGKFIQESRTGPKRMRVYHDTVRINKGIDPKKFTVKFPQGCKMWDDNLETSYTIGTESDPPLDPDSPEGKKLLELMDLKIKTNPERARSELISILRDFKIGENKNKWFAAIRALIQIGSPAVPELAAELKRTEKAWTQSALAFILRAIGDASAVPALINALGRCEGGSDYGIRISKCNLHRFIRKHQIDPSEPDLTLGRPVREITVALEKLTGHSEGHKHFYNYDEKGNRVYVYLDTPENRARTRKMHQAVAQRWRLWWEKNKQTVLKRDAQNRLNR